MDGLREAQLDEEAEGNRPLTSPGPWRLLPHTLRLLLSHVSCYTHGGTSELSRKAEGETWARVQGKGRPQGRSWTAQAASPRSFYSLGWLPGVLGLYQAQEGRPQGLPWRPASGFLLGHVNPLSFQKRALSGGGPRQESLA